MKPLLALSVLALPALWFFPAEWRVALAIGWVPMMLAEAILFQRRKVLMQSEGGGTQLLMLMTFGFLGRLSFLVVGAIVGAKAELFPEGPFMASCLAAIAVGEALSLTTLARANRQRRAAQPASARDTPKS
jgi:hypothetical protein